MSQCGKPWAHVVKRPQFQLCAVRPRIKPKAKQILRARDKSVKPVAGILAFGLGLSGGRIFDRPTEPATSPETQPLSSALTSGMYRPAAAVIPNPNLAARLEFLEDLTSTELADLPDLIRRLMEERDSEWRFKDILPVIDR